VAVYVPLWRRQLDDVVLVQASGGVLATGGLVLWLGGVPIAALLPWLVGFIMLTIGGERLELARLAMGPAAGRRLLSLAAGVVAGVVASLLWPAVGYPLLGLTTLVFTGGLGFHDVAWRTISRRGSLGSWPAACWPATAGWPWRPAPGC
jgi:hypothetical protein